MQTRLLPVSKVYHFKFLPKVRKKAIIIKLNSRWRGLKTCYLCNGKDWKWGTHISSVTSSSLEWNSPSPIESKIVECIIPVPWISGSSYLFDQKYRGPGKWFRWEANITEVTWTLMASENKASSKQETSVNLLSGQIDNRKVSFIKLRRWSEQAGLEPGDMPRLRGVAWASIALEWTYYTLLCILWKWGNTILGFSRCVKYVVPGLMKGDKFVTPTRTSV